MAALLYRITGFGGSQIEVFDRRITVVERRIGATLADDVAQLAMLKDRGVLTDDEFTAAKQRLLSEDVE